jgi:hypothetical protein
MPPSFCDSLLAAQARQLTSIFGFFGAATHPLYSFFVGAAALVILAPCCFRNSQVLFVEYTTLSALPMPFLEYTPALLVFSAARRMNCSHSLLSV